MPVYCDYSATTPLHPEVLHEMLPYLTTHFGNASSAHAYGREARRVVDTQRRKIADLLGVRPGEITFTSGGTEADNFALRASVQQFNIRHVLTTRIEHKAVLAPLRQLAQRGRIDLHFIALDGQGRILLPDFIRLLQQYPGALVSLMHANNEIGNVLDTEAIAALCRRYGALLHSDTVQTVGKLAFPGKDVDFAAASAHKFYGPKGIGFLYNRGGKTLPAILAGGGQENGLRGGTENVAGIVGLASALELALAGQPAAAFHLEKLKSLFVQRLSGIGKPVAFNGQSRSIPGCLPGLVSVRFPETDRPLAELLDERGIAVSGGSACSNLAGGSHVLQELPEAGNGQTIRFSFGKDNTTEDIDTIIRSLQEIYAVPSRRILRQEAFR